MLRTLLLVLSLSMSFSALALEIQFVGACSQKPLLIKKLTYEPGMNVGDLSLQVLDAHQIPYDGTAAGLNQAFGTPLGLEAMEVLNDNEMMAYGWCFEVDGIIPEVFADKVPVRKSTKLITWFYGYAHFLKGEWVSQCEKSYLRHPPAFCRDRQ